MNFECLSLDGKHSHRYISPQQYQRSRCRRARLRSAKNRYTSYHDKKKDSAYHGKQKDLCKAWLGWEAPTRVNHTMKNKKISVELGYAEKHNKKSQSRAKDHRIAKLGWEAQSHVNHSIESNWICIAWLVKKHRHRSSRSIIPWKAKAKDLHMAELDWPAQSQVNHIIKSNRTLNSMTGLEKHRHESIIQWTAKRPLNSWAWLSSAVTSQTYHTMNSEKTS